MGPPTYATMSSAVRRRVTQRFFNEWPKIEEEMRLSFEESLSDIKPIYGIESTIEAVLKQHIGTKYTEIFSKCLKGCKSAGDYNLANKFYKAVDNGEKRAVGRLAFMVARLYYNQLTNTEDAGRNRDLKLHIREINQINSPLVSSAFSTLSTLVSWS